MSRGLNVLLRLCTFYAILMRTKKFETRLYLNSNFENYDIELKKYFIKRRAQHVFIAYPSVDQSLVHTKFLQYNLQYRRDLLKLFSYYLRKTAVIYS